MIAYKDITEYQLIRLITNKHSAKGCHNAIDDCRMECFATHTKVIDAE